MPSHAHHLWVLVADASQARIIQVTTESEQPAALAESPRPTAGDPSRNGPAGTTQAQPFRANARGHEQARLVNTHPEADRERPARTDAAGHTIQHADTEGERLRRFAAEVTHWITEQMNASLLGQLVVFAPAKMLVHFRAMFPKEGLASVALKEANLVYISAPEIANHPAVAEAMQPAGTSS